jgi:hypothetical protein
MAFVGQVENNTGNACKKTTAGILKDRSKLVNLNRLFLRAVADCGRDSFLLTKKWWCIRGKGKFVSFPEATGSIFCLVPWQCDLVYQFF